MYAVVSATTVDAAVPVYDARTMDAFMARAYMAPRLAALVIGPAAIIALVIAPVAPASRSARRVIASSPSNGPSMASLPERKLTNPEIGGLEQPNRNRNLKLC